jgi:hypothetical protein
MSDLKGGAKASAMACLRNKMTYFDVSAAQARGSCSIGQEFETSIRRKQIQDKFAA